MGKNSESSQGLQKKEIKEKFQICHLCMKNTTESAQCSIKRCKNSFCFECIISSFNKDFKPAQYVQQCWVCFSCGGSCKCLFCTGIDRNRKKRSTKLQNSQKTPQTSKINDEKQSYKDNSKEIDEKPSQQKCVQSKIHKSRYQRRRLPAKKKIVFKYKTKRRSRNKGSNEIKNLLQKMDEKDKILKIKRQDVHEQLSEQHQNSNSQEVQSISDSQESQQINQKSQIIEEKVEEKMEEVKQQNSKTLQNITGKEPDKQVSENHSETDSKGQNCISSSLDFLQQKEGSRNLRNLTKKLNQNKREKKNILLEILTTIKSVGSQIQAEKVIKVQDIKEKKENEEQQKKQENIISPVDEGVNTRQTRSRGNRQDSSKRNNLFQMIQQNVKKRRYTRRAEKIEENRKNKSDKKQRKQKQVQQRQVQRPRRSTRKNYVEIQEGNNLTGRRLRKSRRNTSKQQIQLSSEMDQQCEKIHSENSNDDQDIENRSNKIQQPQQNQSPQSPESQQQYSKNNQERRKHKNKDIKKHYQEQLEKNIRFQVNDSESSDNQENAEKDNKKNQDKNKDFDLLFEENVQSIQVGQSKNIQVKLQIIQQPESGKKAENISLKDVKPSDTKGQQQGTKVYRKGAANKRNHHINSHTKLNQTSRNSIAIKWAAIPDKYLIDINNIKRLGYQALFARQNLSKEMNQLIQRRNKILSQIEKSSVGNKVKLS